MSVIKLNFPVHIKKQTQDQIQYHTPLLGCTPPAGYTPGASSSKHYKLLDATDWSTARKQCAQDGAWLAMYWSDEDFVDIAGAGHG